MSAFSENYVFLFLFDVKLAFSRFLHNLIF